MEALDRTTIMVIYDIECRVKEANRKFLTITGYELEEISGKSIDLLRSGFHDEEFYSKMRISLRKGLNWSGEICNRNKDGKLFWTYSVIAPFFDERGDVIACIELGQDITALKLAQAQAIQAGKMATLGEMASGVAHEINNPLAVISGRVALLKKRLAGESEEAQKNVTDLEKIESQVSRITKIVSGLRSFARSSANDPKVAASIKKIVEDSVELVIARYLKSNVQVHVVPFDDVQIPCRHIEISQVLVNLLNNAFDAVSELAEKWIRIEIESSNSELKIMVTDSGSGISSDIVEKMMNPFFTTKEVGKGTGLGLSISKGIIEDHGGTLTYNPDASHTQFIVKLPIYSQ
jgi:PAS domain S-box-containing protein